MLPKPNALKFSNSVHPDRRDGMTGGDVAYNGDRAAGGRLRRPEGTYSLFPRVVPVSSLPPRQRIEYDTGDRSRT